MEPANLLASPSETKVRHRVEVENSVSPVTGEFPAQMSSNAENVSIR